MADTPLFSRRPLVGLALCYVAGTGSALFLRVPADTIGAAAVAVLAAVAVGMLSRSLRRNRCSSTLRLAAIPVGVFLAAWIAALARHEDDVAAAVSSSCAGLAGGASPDAAAVAASGDGVYVRGVVAGDSEQSVAGRGNGRVRSFALKTLQVSADGTSWLNCRSRVMVSWYGYGPPGSAAPTHGETWYLFGRFAGNNRAGRSGVPLLRVNSRDSVLLRRRAGGSFPALCFKARRSAAGVLSVGIEEHPDTVGTLHALLLGYRSRLERDRQRLFAATGTLHIFAVSGLHVAIVGGLIVTALKTLRVSRVYWALWLTPLLVGYTIGTGARASAVRACIMAVVYFLAPLVGRKSDVPSTLALAITAILAWDPGQLLDTGFIFSFTVVTGLIVMYPVFARPLRRLWDRDPSAVEADTKGEALWREFRRYVASLAALSCAAWVSSVPLTAHYFGNISLIALIGNMLVIPLATLILLTGSLSLLFSVCGPFFPDVFNHANLALVGVLFRTTDLLSRAPFACVETGRPPLWGLALWYVCAALGALLLRRPRRRSCSNPEEQDPIACR